jgi:hypothetical protein
MRKRWRWLLYALLAGSFLCLVDRFQPFRLRALKIKDLSPELEWSLREWSESFLSFHPGWLLRRGVLEELEARYPLKADVGWNPLSGTLTLTPVPFEPKMKVEWQHGEYLISEKGTAWRIERWEKALNLPVPKVPTLKVGNSFPLLSDLGINSSARLLVPFDWLYSVLESVKSRRDMTISEPELVRRGGEDVVICQIENLKKKSRASFIGLASKLDESLAVAAELMEAKAGQNMTVDATYEDKVIIKKFAEPSQQP